MSAHSVADATPGEDNFAMKSAGKLQAAMDLGAYDERFDATHDQFQAQGVIRDAVEVVRPR
jgi:hypothetical protein